MTEEAKLRYEDDKPYYEIIRTIVKEEVKEAIKPMNMWQNRFYSVALLIFGFMFGVQFFVWKELSAKATTSEVVGKLQYYQIEEDEHRMLLELEPDVNKATNVFNKINDNTAAQLGFKYTTRGEVK